ncbi:MAG: cation:proton antiporter [Phycisphaerales bacterium]|nr:cation:proton antiporter [Phycisphaerales bacterium]
MHQTITTTLAGASVHDLPLLTTIAAAFAVAWVLGLITQKLKLSPIVGYLLAGVVIGPYTPGYTGDVTLASQLAEVGVILLMFGVGLHFHLKDLLAVKDVAIPGALGQSLLATLASAIIFSLLGFDLSAGLTLGIAMAVASTVVLLRVLLDQGMLNTSHGHVAVGWLIVEDILTVILLVLIPLFAFTPPPDPASTSAALTTAAATTSTAPASSLHPALAVLLALGKLALMVLVVFVIGSRVIPKILNAIAKLRSSELFTLTVLVLSVAIAVGSAALFGTSVALGAFLAGMVVAQSKLSHQAAADALPMRHAFAVIFFVSIGMLLNPRFLIEQPLLLVAALAVVLIVKPLAALAIVAICGYPVRTALTVALGLAQIGEFSFIVGQAAVQHNLMPEAAMQILVAAAIVSITINPLLFRSIDRFENALRKLPKLYNLLSARHARRAAAFNATTHEKLAASADSTKPYAVIAGYGPVGRLVDAMLRDANFETLVIDMNVDTVQSLTSANRLALFGDATQHAILEEANLRKASHLIITHPSVEGLASLVVTAREINPTIEVIVRARYLAEGEALRDAGATYVVFEEGETGLALARYAMQRRNIDAQTAEKLLAAVRATWRMDDHTPPTPSAGGTQQPPI